MSIRKGGVMGLSKLLRSAELEKPRLVGPTLRSHEHNFLLQAAQIVFCKNQYGTDEKNSVAHIM